MSIKLSKFLFFFVLIFSPLAFGTTESWSYAVMETGTVFAVLFFFIHVIKHNETLVQVPALMPLLLFLFFISFQVVPLPPTVVKWLSPAAFDIHSAAGNICGTDAWMPLSVNIKATFYEFFRCSTYVLFYVLTVQLLKERSMLQGTVFAVAVFGGLLAFSSILQFYLTDDMALWFRHSPNNSIVVGPYANHNHYAGLMEMIFPIVLSLFLFYRPRIGDTSILKGIAQILSQEKANIHILIGTSALLIVISIFVSLSRGAMISTCLSLLLFTFLLLKRRISRGNTILIIGIIMATSLAVGWFGWDQIFDRFARLKNAQGIIYESRLDFWKDTLSIISYFPLTGAGAGAFAHIYPLHRTIISDRFLTHAHNDYLELLAETGITGFCLAAAFVIILVYKTYNTFVRRKEGFCIYVYMGGITAVCAILLHSLTDFNLRIGANGLWFFFIAGTLVSTANTGFRKQSVKTKLPEIKGKLTGTMGFILVCFLASATTAFQISHLMGQFYYTNVRQYSINSKTPRTDLKKLDKTAGLAMKVDPLTADYPFFKANTQWFLDQKDQALHNFKTAVLLSPLNSRYLNRFAEFSARQRKTDTAQLAFEKSMQYDRTNPEYTFQYAAFLIAVKNEEKALNYLKTVLTLDAGFMDRVLTLMIVNGMDNGQIEKVIPDLAATNIAFAQFLFDTGNPQRSVERYLLALKLLEEQQIDPFSNLEPQKRKIRSQYFRILKFFSTHNDLKNAMLTMEQAEKKFPMDDRVKVAMGNLYYRQGILYKAIEKYEHALIIRPDNQQALKMITKLNP